MKSSGVAAGGTDASAHAVFLWKEREAKAGLLESRPRAGPGQSNGRHKSTARAVPVTDPCDPSPAPRAARSGAAHTGFCWRRHLPPQGVLQAQPPPPPNPHKSRSTYRPTQARQGAAVTEARVVLVWFDILQTSIPPDKLSSS